MRNKKRIRSDKRQIEAGKSLAIFRAAILVPKPANQTFTEEALTLLFLAYGEKSLLN